MHATLQVVHHAYFREDDKTPIPAATLKLVFREMAERQKVELRWLAVDGQAMNADHKPRDEFEKQAAAAIAAPKMSFFLLVSHSRSSSAVPAIRPVRASAPTVT